MEDQQGFMVVLASASPRRCELLESRGVAFTVRTPHDPVDEKLDADLLLWPEEAAKKLAERKAGAVVQELLSEGVEGTYIVIGADTMVVHEGEIFGKPRYVDDAKRMLRALSGDSHEVITAVSVWMVAAGADDNVSLGFRTFADTARVTFRELGEEEMTEYLRLGESFDKAGAYAIQGEARRFVTGVEGDEDTVIGLPVSRLLREFPDLDPNAPAASSDAATDQGALL